MTTEDHSVQVVRTMLCGAIAILVTMQIGIIVGSDKPNRFGSALLCLALEIALIVLATHYSIKKFINRPYRSSAFVTAGALVGITVDIIIHPTINGYDRNLVPFEIALQTIMAAIFSYSYVFIHKVFVKYQKHS